MGGSLVSRPRLAAPFGPRIWPGLRNLRDRLGEKFIAGFVLYAGQQTLPFGDRLRALPLEALWKTRP